MGKKRKIISLIVSVAMLVAMFPMIVHADGENPYEIGTWDYLQYELTNSDGPVSLDRDYTAGDGDSSLIINKSVTLFLNGYKIDRGLSNKEASPNGHVFDIVPGGTLVMPQGSSAGMITGGNALYGGGILVETGGTLIFQEGMIVGNKTVYAEGEKNSGCGSGVFVAPGGYVQVSTYSGITGLITGNSGGLYGGGIYLAGTMSVSGGQIISNRIEEGGKGSDIYVASSGNLEMGGTPSVDEVYLSGTQKIAVASASFSSGAKIGVVTEAELPAAITTDYDKYKPTGIEATQIFSSTQGTIDISADGEVIITDEGGQHTTTPVTIKTCNVTLGGSLGVNIYVDYGTIDDAAKEASTVTVAISGKNTRQKIYTFDDAVPRDFDTTTCYGYTFEISSIEMADRIQVIVSYEGGDPVVKDFTVEDYLTALEENWQTYGYTYNEKLVAEMMANYGYYIQRYLDYTNSGWSVANNDHQEFTARYNPMDSDTIGENIYTMVKNATQDAAYQPNKVVDENSKITKLTYSLEFGTTIALEIFFTVEAGTEFSATATCASTGKTYRAYLADDGRYKIRISGLLIQDLANTFVSVTGTAGSDFSLDVHPFGYIYSSVNTSATTEKALLRKNAMTALYLFYNQLPKATT
ncbi:MAG: hypothetical protein K6A81_08685 [Clostridiales bacterium]|nr:hypothetical protein [Clostridiales bacterium]